MVMPFLFVILLGSANIRIGLAQQDVPFNIPHCIARRTTGANQAPKKIVQDQVVYYLLFSNPWAPLSTLLEF